jgi:hypothetical protein
MSDFFTVVRSNKVSFLLPLTSCLYIKKKKRTKDDRLFNDNRIVYFLADASRT